MISKIWSVLRSAVARAYTVDVVTVCVHPQVGDCKSLAIHPATTTHSQLSAEQMAAGDLLPIATYSFWSLARTVCGMCVQSKPLTLFGPPVGGIKPELIRLSVGIETVAGKPLRP
jgi:cystathionine beta-lyase/cystathionine gamma-synthase